MIDTIIHFFTTQLPEAIVFVAQSRWTPIQELSPIMVGVLIQMAIILLII